MPFYSVLEKKKMEEMRKHITEISMLVHFAEAVNFLGLQKN